MVRFGYSFFHMKTKDDNRQAFSGRLVREFERIGLSIASPTNIADEFQMHCHPHKVSAQTIRKWIQGDAYPTQDKLAGLAAWLGVAPQWLRYGEGARKVAAGSKQATPDETVLRFDRKIASAELTEMKQIIELLIELSLPNLRLVKSLVRGVLSEQEKTH